MHFTFFKYHGTGNDFIIIDNRLPNFPKNDTNLVQRLCDRRFGIGADGLILLEEHPTLDFEMVYFNADGRTSSMCGNGGRCIVHFAEFMQMIRENTRFQAIDGSHHASFVDDGIALQMKNVEKIDVREGYCWLNTGSPHHVQLVKDVATYDIQENGKKLRYGLYGEKGSNINFVQQLSEDTFEVRTYERGVEAETYSCGTGVTAVAIAMHKTGKTKANRVHLETPGGKLSVQFTVAEDGYKDIFLIGPAVQVYRGDYHVQGSED